jgi:hypothetical protein
MNTPRTPSTRSNIERLNAEGFEIDTDIPKEYAEVIEDLRPDEIELIIDVTRRLDLAQEHALKCDPKAQPYTTYMHTF